MAERRPCAVLPVELVAEILVRLPPREPAYLLRASLACKTWGRAVSYPGFRGRLHDLHKVPPVLGFLHNWEGKGVPRFIRTTASPFSLAAPDCGSWRALDFRHGRALFLSKGQDAGKELLLWDPITGVQQRVPVPLAFERDNDGAEQLSPTAAVFCAGAAGGCDHRDCQGRPFRLVFVFSVEVGTTYVTSALVYSSETGQWGEPTSTQGVLSMTQGVLSMEFTHYSSVLVEMSLLYFMTDNALILEYNLATHNLAVLHPPDQSGYPGRFNILLAEGGGLGFCQYLYPKLKMWKREASDDTDAQWVQSRSIYLVNLPIGDLLEADTTVQVMGFAEEADVIFFNMAAGIFTLERQSRQARKVFGNYGFCNVIPVVTFYTPVPRGEHQGGLVNSSECIRHGFENRDLSCGEVASECAGIEDKHGHALSSEAQEVTGPLGDVPDSAPNEELVKTTSVTSKDDAGNSKTSGSNVEDAAPTSEKR
ncbi:unnamed protein product [Alopecurus aequalis]